jgi:sugar phosphate permease
VTASAPQRYRWRILALAVGAQGASAALFQGLPSIAPSLAAAYGLSVAQVGAALGSLIFGMTLTLLAWGIAADRFGERWVITIGLVGTAVSLAALGATGSYAGLVVGLFVAGLWAASANAASGRAVVRWFAPAERGTALGIRQAAIPLGGALGAALLPLIAAAQGAHGSLVALSLVIAVAAFAVALWLKDPPGGAAGGSPRGLGLGVLLRDGPMWRLVGVTLLLVGAQYTFIGFLVLFLYDARGVPPTRAALALVAVQLLGAAARIVAGRWSDALGSRRVPLQSLGVGCSVGLAALALTADAPDALLLPILFATATVALSWNGLAFTAAAEAAPPGASGSALGLQNTALALGAALFLPLFAALVEGTSWTAGFALVAALPLVAVLLLRGLRV